MSKYGLYISASGRKLASNPTSRAARAVPTCSRAIRLPAGRLRSQAIEKIIRGIGAAGLSAPLHLKSSLAYLCHQRTLHAGMDIVVIQHLLGHLTLDNQYTAIQAQPQETVRKFREQAGLSHIKIPRPAGGGSSKIYSTAVCTINLPLQKKQLWGVGRDNRTTEQTRTK